ncbi:MAG: uncharacterized protein QOJ54_3493 [Aliidongia sp.]|jgi:hypothetical protein|nr:uncharacterized protein [Aliidongia sp.]
MAKPTLRYDKMVEKALRGVVREALTLTAEHGLPGAHHFYVTFRTDYPGVEIPGFLRAQYPREMTIVLEHQFSGLDVDESRFSVTLSFQGQGQRLIVPLIAITAFADPSVPWGLEFPVDPAAAAPATPVEAIRKEPAGDKPGEVVKLDAFRKK